MKDKEQTCGCQVGDGEIEKKWVKRVKRYKLLVIK